MVDSASDTNQRLAAGMASEVPKIYFNAFVTAQSQADVICVLERNGTPVGTLNMSFTIAKTLAASLGQVIASLETHAGREIMTTADIEKFISGEKE